MRKRTIAVPLSVLAAAAGVAGGAYAASQPNSHLSKASSCGSERAVINDVARRLHVTPTRLSDAFKQALIDQINAAVAAGRLSRAQANAIKGQIEHSAGLPFGPGLLAPAVKAAGVVTARGVAAPPGGFPATPALRGPGLVGPPAIVTGAARYLGLTEAQLKQRLGHGESLAQIAKAQGKSVSGLERTITAAVKSQLESAVKAGRIPRAVEQHLLAAITRGIPQVVNASGPLGPLSAKRQMRVQVHAGGRPACFAAGIGLAPPPVLKTWIAPQKR